jgi:hypothetical protein
MSRRNGRREAGEGDVCALGGEVCLCPRKRKNEPKAHTNLVKILLQLRQMLLDGVKLHARLVSFLVELLDFLFLREQSKDTLAQRHPSVQA